MTQATQAREMLTCEDLPDERPRDLPGRRVRKLARRTGLATRLALGIARTLVDSSRPLMVQIIPMRRCNLACSYCNQYDDVSAAVPLATMLARIDRLADLGTLILTLSGGEPLLHPDADALIAHIRRRGMVATLITNGYLLSSQRIDRLNRAGLDHLQISIDNVEPDEVSKKSLRVLDHRLRWLSERAEFAINVNSVVGGGIRKPADALAVARRARELGFSSTVGLLNGHEAELARQPEEMRVYRELRGLRDWASAFNGRWQDRIAAGQVIDWRCRAGARYLYVDELGLVHYCSAQRGAPGIPLESYGRDEILRAFHGRKACAPCCTINCVQQASWLDHWRGPQRTEAKTVPLVVKPAPSIQERLSDTQDTGARGSLPCPDPDFTPRHGGGSVKPGLQARRSPAIAGSPGKESAVEKSPVIVLALLLGLAASVRAEEAGLLSKGRMELSTSASISRLSDSDDEGEAVTTVNLPLRAGFFVSDHLSLEAELLASYVDFAEDSQTGLLASGSILYHFNPQRKTTPFVLVGAGGGNAVEYYGLAADEDRPVAVLHAGLGVKTAVGRRAAFRTEYRFSHYRAGRDETRSFFGEEDPLRANHHRLFVGISLFFR